MTVNETGVIRMGTSLGGRIRHEARGFGVFHFDIVAAAQEFNYILTVSICQYFYTLLANFF